MTRFRRFWAPVLAAGLLACSPADRGASDEPLAEAEVPEAGPRAGVDAPARAAHRPAGEAVADVPLLAALGPGEDWIGPFLDRDLDELFQAVAAGIRYEPYTGILRGPAGTALGRSGNSLDQSLLLAEALRANGYRVRFVRGTLTGDNLAALLQGMYPPGAWELQALEEFGPYDPQADARLRAAAADHFWLEVDQGSSWLPLDPSFPRAEAGEAYAEAADRFGDPPADLHHRIAIAVKEDVRGARAKTIATVEGTPAELGLRPIALAIRAIPQSSTGAEGGPPSAAGAMGGFGGALAGRPPPEPKAKEAPAEPQRVGVRYRRQFTVGGHARDAGSTFVLETRQDHLRREWLEFTLTAPGERPRTVERTLFEAAAAGTSGSGPAGPPEYRHYTIAIVPGPVPHHWVAAQAAKAGAALDLPAWSRALERTAARGADAADDLEDLSAQGDLAGTVAGHLITLSYAAEADVLARRLGAANGLVLAWAAPRILISSVETAEGEAQVESSVSLDLRLDQVAAYPYPGAPAGTAPLFQVARGLQNSSLEAEVIRRATGLASPVSTSAVMAHAHAADVPVLVVNSRNRAALRQIDRLPRRCQALIQDALRRGRDVVVPTRAIAYAGTERWAWWEIDPDSGDLIGVMESGQHQALAEYKLSLERVGMRDEAGFVIGAMTGGVTTHFAIAGLMLKYGEVTEELIAAVEKMVESIMCSSCFKGAGVEAGESVSIGLGNECFDKSEKLKDDTTSASLTVNFCEQYQKGFACASGMILRGLKGEPALQNKATYTEKSGISASVNCQDYNQLQDTTRVTVTEGGGVTVGANGTTIVIRP